MWTLSTPLVYIVFMPTGRHQHKEVAKALLEAKKAGFLVTELHAGHVWGKVVAPNGQELKVWSTPRSAETMAKRIREFVRKYPPERSR